MDANQVSLRCELEFCFAEAALVLGPEFISDSLLHHDTGDAETVLLNFYVDHGTHDWTWPCWGGVARANLNRRERMDLSGSRARGEAFLRRCWRGWPSAWGVGWEM